MSVDVRLVLPDNVRVNDVAKVIGKLIGCESRRENFHSGSSWAVTVDGVKVKPTRCVEMPEIEIVRDGMTTFSCYYHFEAGLDGRLIILSASAYNIALCCSLVEFFGGSVELDNSDDFMFTITWKARALNSPSDNTPWYALQERILGLKAMTQEYISRFDKYAIYK